MRAARTAIDPIPHLQRDLLRPEPIPRLHRGLAAHHVQDLAQRGFGVGRVDLARGVTLEEFGEERSGIDLPIEQQTGERVDRDASGTRRGRLDADPFEQRCERLQASHRVGPASKTTGTS